ncbi:MAG TPA: tyrosine-type recombinase/integrase [Armatimonadota bacterium]|nr:tyrosine-type recombinase/integrase [Armatimonadota bacterium]
MARGRKAADGPVEELWKGRIVKVGRVSVYRRGRWYHCYFHLDGKRHREQLDTDDARVALETARTVDASLGHERPSEVMRSLADRAAGVPSLRVSALMDALEANRKAAGLSKSYLSWLGWRRRQAQGLLGSLKVRSIARADCEGVLSAVTGRRGMAQYLRTLLRFAVAVGYIDRSPMSDVRVPAPGRSRLPMPFHGAPNVPQYLLPGQVAEYRGVFAGTLLDGPYLLGLYAGLRLQEIVFLEWPRVSLRSHTLQVAAVGEWRPKSRQARTLPLHAELYAWLSAHRKRWGPVCPSPEGKRWQPRNLRRKADMIIDAENRRRKADNPRARTLKRLGFHTLRHTFAVAAAGAGIPLTTIQAWLGHADLSTTQLYAHFSPAYQREGIERVAF